MDTPQSPVPGNMGNGNGNMNMEMDRVVYWHPNQVSIMFHSGLDSSAGSAAIIETLHLDSLNQFIQQQTGFTLKSFGKQDVPHPRSSDEDDQDDESSENPTQEGGQDVEQAISGERVEEEHSLNSPRGKYLFRDPSGEGTLVSTFFHIEAPNNSQNMAMTQPSEQGGANGMDEYGPDNTPTVVNLINNSIGTLNQQQGVPATAGAPNWLSGGTPDLGGCQTHGCPAMPPIPVPVDTSCSASNSTGYWPITLPELSPQLSSDQQQGHRTGSGVKVFVLDTLPKHEDISTATRRAGDNNLLLKQMVGPMEPSGSEFSGVAPSIKVNDQDLQADLDVLPGASSMVLLSTGKDIHGKLVGFKMEDHGLFVAGIIRGLAPDASIECIRILNDYGVGDIAVLTRTLRRIQTRMESGNLQGTSVVINLSLVLVPPMPEDMIKRELDADTPEKRERLRKNLHDVIQSLASSGAVIVAAAGNDSNSPDMPGRQVVRYPAAFAEVISVGAVTKGGTAATYSNRSGSGHGIATWGGEIPRAVEPQNPQSPACKKPIPECNSLNSDCMTTADPTTIDAFVGVYTSGCYPRLASTGPDDPLTYQAPNTNAWAYWVGTSFSTPIITGVVARILQAPSLVSTPTPTPGVSTPTMAEAIVSLITNGALTSSVVLPMDPDLQVPVLMAEQCSVVPPTVTTAPVGSASQRQVNS